MKVHSEAAFPSVHLDLSVRGEGKDEMSLETLPGRFTITCTEEALTPYGGLAAWSGGFLKHLGIVERSPSIVRWRVPVLTHLPQFKEL